MKVFRSVLFALVLCAASASASAAESAPARRCGWLDNPTPGNWWLHDRDGEWTLGEQGGYQAQGLDDLPDMSTQGVIPANAPHGYSCACITATVDVQSRRVLRIVSGAPVPLAQCKADKAIRRP